MVFTEHQATAIGSPCYEAEECANQKFRRFRRLGNMTLSLLLTVNVGEE